VNSCEWGSVLFSLFSHTNIKGARPAPSGERLTQQELVFQTVNYVKAKRSSSLKMLVKAVEKGPLMKKETWGEDAGKDKGKVLVGGRS